MKKLRDLIIYCDRGSDTAHELSSRLNARRLRANSVRRLRRIDGSLLVNYGTSSRPGYSLGSKSIVLNSFDSIAKAISKRVSHECFTKEGVPCLEQTTDRALAASWVQDGSGVLCRRDGLSGGKGIVFVPKGQESVPEADFYTKYFAKTHEYRAHVFRGRLIDLTQKRLQNGTAKSDDDPAEKRIIRSMENGWIHAHESIHLPGDTRTLLGDAAIKACAAIGLDFGAVDILAQFSKKEPTKLKAIAVCEVNTAPGLGNEVTLKAYQDAIRLVYEETKQVRAIPVRKRVRKEVLVWITTKRGNRVQRLRSRLVYE